MIRMFLDNLIRRWQEWRQRRRDRESFNLTDRIGSVSTGRSRER